MKREEILVSVTVTSYNHVEFVGRAIESILAQTYKNLEIVIIDDGSTDGSVEIIAGYHDPRINFIRCAENTSFAAYENAFQMLKGKYIVETCSDDVLFPEMIEKYVDFMEEHEEFGCVFCVPQIIDEEDNLVGEGGIGVAFNQPNRTREQWFRHLFMTGNCLCNPSVCFRRTLFEKVKPYRFQFRQLQDWDLWLRVLQITNIYVFQEELMQYRIHMTKENHNMSTPTEEAVFRDKMERKYIHLEIIEKIKDDFFIKAFEDELILHPGQEGFCVECEKFSILLNSSIIHPQVAVFYYFRHYDDEKFRFCMENYYHVSRKDFWEYSGADFDHFKERIQSLEEIVKVLKQINKQLQMQRDEKERQLELIRNILKS